MPGTPPTTPNLAIPRYSTADAADFPTQYNAGVDRVESALFEPIVTALPTTGLFNGKTVLYQFDRPANQPVGNVSPASSGGGLWRLRYDTSITDIFKWRWLGGSDWYTMATYSWGPPGTSTAEIDDPELKFPAVLPGYYDAWSSVFGTFYPAGPNEIAAMWGLTSIAGFDNWQSRADGMFEMQNYVMRPIRVSVLAGANIRVRWMRGYANDYISRLVGSALWVRPHRVG